MIDSTSHQTFLHEAIAFIVSLEVRDGLDVVTSKIKCLQEWLVTLNAILQVWEHINTHYNFKFLVTTRLNSDPIDNFLKLCASKVVTMIMQHQCNSFVLFFNWKLLSRLGNTPCQVFQ